MRRDGNLKFQRRGRSNPDFELCADLAFHGAVCSRVRFRHRGPIEAACGHHPPPRGAPNSVAKASRTGLVKRRPCTARFMALTMLRPRRRAVRLTVNTLRSTKSTPPLGNPAMTHADSSMTLHFGLIRNASAGIGKRNQSLMIISVGSPEDRCWLPNVPHRRYGPRVATAAAQRFRHPRNVVSAHSVSGSRGRRTIAPDTFEIFQCAKR